MPSITITVPPGTSGTAPITWDAIDVTQPVEVWVRYVPIGPWLYMGTVDPITGSGTINFNFAFDGQKSEVWVGNYVEVASSLVNTSPGTPTISVNEPAYNHLKVSWSAVGLMGPVEVWCRPHPYGTWVLVGTYDINAGNTGGDTYDFGPAGTVTEIWIGGNGGQVVGTRTYTSL